MRSTIKSFSGLDAGSITKALTDLIAGLRASYRLALGLFWATCVALLVPLIFMIAKHRTGWRKGFPEYCMLFLSRRFYRSFNVKVRYFGNAIESGSLVIPNHVSWLDIVVLTGRWPLGFVAKSEVRSWPVFGAVGMAVGTLFINRESKFSVYRSLPQGEAILARDQSLVVFPEGTTTIGQQALPFYPMTFEIAVRQKAKVQPIALRYLNTDGSPSSSAPFVGDDGFLQSLWRIAFTKETIAEVHIMPTLDAAYLNRKQLAQLAQQEINQTLQTQGLTAVTESIPSTSGLPVSLNR